MRIHEGLDCKPFADALREFNHHAAAWIVETGVRDPEAVAAIRRDLEVADRSEQEDCYRALDGLVDCYARGEETRVLRALSAWDRAGCASCASRIAIVDAHASGCADCADGGAS